MRIALLEASHWHVPLYLGALEAPGIDVVAISDAENVQGGQLQGASRPAFIRRATSCWLARRSTLHSRSAGTRRCLPWRKR
jgi:hypothetical protein